MAVTIKDIARELNLAKSTVSYALNGGPRPVSSEVRARVLQAAREMGFRPNPVGQALAAGRTRTIGFAPNRFDATWMFSQFAGAMVANLYALAHERGLHILLPSGYDPQRPEQTQDSLFTAPVDGYILLLSGDETIRQVTDVNVPLVAVGTRPNLSVPTVNADNVGGTRMAIQHLLALGHRKIGLLGSTAVQDTHERFQTFLEFHRQGLVESESAWIVDCGTMYEDGYRGAHRLFARERRPTAVVCVNDLVACACLRVAHLHGLQVPQDLSVIGFDDDTVAAVSATPLTTIQQPFPEMALAALEGLLSRIDGTEVSDAVLPTKLIVRASTASPSGESPS